MSVEAIHIRFSQLLPEPFNMSLHNRAFVNCFMSKRRKTSRLYWAVFESQCEEFAFPHFVLELRAVSGAAVSGVVLFAFLYHFPFYAC